MWFLFFFFPTCSSFPGVYDRRRWSCTLGCSLNPYNEVATSSLIRLLSPDGSLRGEIHFQAVSVLGRSTEPRSASPPSFHTGRREPVSGVLLLAARLCVHVCVCVWREGGVSASRLLQWNLFSIFPQSASTLVAKTQTGGGCKIGGARTCTRFSREARAIAPVN